MTDTAVWVSVRFVVRSLKTIIFIFLDTHRERLAELRHEYESERSLSDELLKSDVFKRLTEQDAPPDSLKTAAQWNLDKAFEFSDQLALQYVGESL